jgi:hypothetical protein
MRINKFEDSCIEIILCRLGMVAQAYNPSYSEGEGRVDCKGSHQTPFSINDLVREYTCHPKLPGKAQIG